MTKYSFDNAWEKARQRLYGIEALFDPGTIRILEKCGVKEGWHCLEVGGGGGSITKWLCERVGPLGRVLATDIDTRFLETLGNPNLEVRRHNIATDDLPPDAFDLVHSRAVFEHLPERDQALGRMVSALNPGGWLVCEDLDDLSITLVSPSDKVSMALYMKIQDARRSAMRARGFSPDYGRRLALFSRSKGLVDVQSEGRVILIQAGSGAQFVRLTIEQLREDLVGLVTEDEIVTFLELVDNPAYMAVAPTMFAAWGRRPAA